jgi:signal transduction histidine kinase/CHASE2 domain-containing sensor protein
LRIPERFLLSAILVALVTGLLLTGWSWKIDQLFYDWKIQHTSRSPASEILIVAIDEKSLDELGRWPWSRSVHARLVDKLSVAGARVIGLDILFSEAATDDPQGDLELISAAASSARVVLPIVNTELILGGQLVETLPYGELSDAAAAIGHVDRQLDPDAIVRSTYLKGGLQSPRWQSFALAMLSVAYPERAWDLPGLRASPSGDETAMVWVRDHQIWIPFAGPPGTVPRVSYADVLMDRLDPGLFSGAIVVVGATAVGLGDLLPTPVSGHSLPMPGVEIVANELDVLLTGLAIRPIDEVLWWCIAVALVLIPALLYSRLPRWSLLIWIGFILLNIGLGLLLLHFTRFWYAPASALIVQLISYPLWSWRRLVQTLIYLNNALKELHSERILPEAISGLPLSESMSFLRCIVPVAGAVVMDDDQRILDEWEEAPLLPADVPQTPGLWQVYGPDAWTRVQAGEDNLYFGVRYNDEVGPDLESLHLLTPAALNFGLGMEEPPRNVVELMQRRLQQVQASTEKIQFMRRFVSDTVAEMAQGVVVTDGLGHVMLANKRAEQYLGLDESEQLEKREITEFLFKLHIDGDKIWPEVLRTAMVDDKPVELPARTQAGLHLLVQLSSFTYNARQSRGLLLSFADVSSLRESERQRRELRAFISHDLRSPLSSILAVTGIARADPQRLGPELLDRIDNHAHRTLALVEEFLEFNRAQTADWDQFVPLNLSVVVHDAIDSVADKATMRDIRLIRKLPDETSVTGDPVLLERVLINLLDNAIKYSPLGATVSVGLVESPDEVRCTIEDTGHGITREDLGRIFDQYYRTGTNREGKPPGLGLGLPFVRVCMERHRGRVEVESEIDQGSKFTLVFPLDQTSLVN